MRKTGTTDGSIAESGDVRSPIKVVLVDVEHCPAEISAAHPGGGRYRGLWVLARVTGEPRALIKLPFVGNSITRAQLAEHFQGPAFGRRPEPAEALPAEPALISVIVCTTFERETELRDCLESLDRLDYPHREVLLVDNRPDDSHEGSAAWMERFPSFRLVRERQPGLSAARNRGLSEASGEIVAFTDDDVVVEAGWLTAFARRFASHPEEVGISGIAVPRELETEAQMRLEEYYGGFGPRIFQPVGRRLESTGRGAFRAARVAETAEGGGRLNVFSLYDPGCLGVGANIAFRADELRSLGGFDVRLGVGTPSKGGEDIVTWIRLAWRGRSLGFEPAAIVWHVHRRGDEQLRQQLADYGVGFSAAMFALIVEDPRHLAAMLAAAPRAAGSLGRRYLKRLRTATRSASSGTVQASSISDLARLELRGIARGPFAYMRSSLLIRFGGRGSK
jgi:GT2 family glycosyltransferase